VPAGDVIDNPAARMKLRLVRTAAETDGDLLEMEATYEPGSVEPPEHFHPKQDERFEILAGTMEVRIGDERKLLEAGEEVFIPAVTPHAMWNGGNETARVAWETRPALRTEEFFRAVAKVAEAAMSGEPLSDDALSGEALLQEFQDEFRLA
jgi:mannose-6-phosphate isomerase-like protein (cupin superfamily)